MDFLRIHADVPHTLVTATAAVSKELLSRKRVVVVKSFWKPQECGRAENKPTSWTGVERTSLTCRWRCMYTLCPVLR